MSIRGHWFRGAVAGLILGIGVAIMLLLYGVVRLGELTSAWVMLGGLVLGVVWSLVAPAPKPQAVAAESAPAMYAAPAEQAPLPEQPEPFYGDATPPPPAPPPAPPPPAPPAPPAAPESTP